MIPIKLLKRIVIVLLFSLLYFKFLQSSLSALDSALNEWKEASELVDSSWKYSYRNPTTEIPSRPHYVHSFKDVPSTVSKKNGFRLKFDRTKVATLIELRRQPHMIPVLTHFLAVIPREWPIIVWCSEENLDQLQKPQIVQREISIGRLELRVLNADLTDRYKTSEFLTSRWFWNQFEAKWILFFQTDSILCSKSNVSLDDWIGPDWDWFGAPWRKRFGGNGGLSLRRKSALLAAISEGGFKRGFMEDVFFSDHMISKGRMPPYSLASGFAYENARKGQEKVELTPFGIHQGKAGKFWGERKWIKDWCPEISMIFQKQLDFDLSVETRIFKDTGIISLFNQSKLKKQ